MRKPLRQLTATERTFKPGFRVRIGGDLSGWTSISQQTLQDAEGIVTDYNAYNCDGPSYLVQLDKPAQLNPITTSDQVWVKVENCFVLS